MAGDSKATLTCSFCHKTQHEVRKLISAAECCICDECVELCTSVIREEDGGAEAKTGLAFAPAQVKAGSAALTEFLEHVRLRYPDGDAAVLIVQDKTTLRMRVTSAADPETLERSIGDAGQVGSSAPQV